MIHHIVMWKLKDFAEGKSKAENAIILKESLEGLKKDIPEIVEIRVGLNIESEYSNFDAVLHSYFNSFETLEKYQNHPTHNIVAEWIGKIRDLRYCVDYEF
ncbi:Dabb family protein [Flavobacterium sp. RSP29]|uniref:Dabb family protein n=1 Tax=Flavobacterium sp. RSP29 TaxID=3401731 RepID=UPI003AAD7BA2